MSDTIDQLRKYLPDMSEALNFIEIKGEQLMKINVTEKEKNK